MKYPIYIPSKGRAPLQKTVKLLTENGIDKFYVIVEKKEYEEYLQYVPKKHILVLPGSDYGTSTVARNFAIEHSTKNGHKLHWQFDDDLLSICEHSRGKKIHTDVKKILEEIESYGSRKNIHVFGMTTTASYLSSVTKDLIMNSMSVMFWLIRNDKFRFRGVFMLPEDYILQVLKAGFNTIKFLKFAINSPSPGKVQGGYTSVYKDDKKRTASLQAFLKLHPEVDPTIFRDHNGFLKLKNVGKVWSKFKVRS